MRRHIARGLIGQARSQESQAARYSWSQEHPEMVLVIEWTGDCWVNSRLSDSLGASLSDGQVDSPDARRSLFDWSSTVRHQPMSLRQGDSVTVRRQ